MTRNQLLAQLPAPATALLRWLDRPWGRRLLLVAAILGGLAIAAIASLADALGFGAEEGFGGLQGFGIVSGLCVVLAAATLAAALDARSRTGPEWLGLGLLTLAAGAVLLAMVLFTGFLGLHESGRQRVIQFAYVEAGTLIVLGAHASWIFGLRDWRFTLWLLPRLRTAWARFDGGVTGLGMPLRRAGGVVARDIAWARPLVRVAGRLPALDLALAAILAAWVAMRSLSLEEGVRAFLVPGAYVLVPFIAGYLVLRVLERVRGGPAWEWTAASRYVLAWFVGAVMLTTLAMLFQHAGFRWGLKNLDVVYLVVVGAGWLAVNMPDHRESMRVRVGTLTAPLRYHWPLLLVIAFALAPRLITGYYNPFPQIERNFSDPRITSQDTLRMIEDGYLTLTNVSHPPAVVSVTAAIAALLRIQPLSIMWAASVAQFAIFAAGFYVLTWRLTRNRLAGLVAAVFGIFIFSGSVGFEGTPLRLRSNTLIYSFFPLTLAAIHEVATRVPAKQGRGILAIGWPLAFIGLWQVVFFLVMNLQVFTGIDIRWRGLILLGAAGALLAAWPRWRGSRFAWAGSPMLLVLVAGWQLFHVYEAPIFVASLLVFALALSFVRDGRDRWLAVLVVGAVGALVAGLLLSEFLPSVTASRIIFGGTYDDKTGGIGQKLRLMDRATAAAAFAFFLLGIGLALRRRDRLLAVAVGLAAAGYAVYFFPDAHTIRSYKVITPFMALLSGVAAAWLYAQFRARTRSPWLAPALGLAGLVVVGYLVSRPLHNHFRAIPPAQSYFSALNDVEYDAIEWLEENTGYDARIISDYQTMQLFNTVGNIPSIVERKYWPAEMTEAGQAQVKLIKGAVLSALSPADAHAAALSLRGTEPEEEKTYLEIAGKTTETQRLFIVLSGKTSDWRLRLSDDPIFNPVNKKPLDSDVERFSDPALFRLVFHVPDPADPGGTGFLYIWEVVQGE